MKSSFSRIFFPAAMVLLCALLLVGTTLRALVRNYLTEQMEKSLQTDAETISQLAQAYYAGGSMTDFLVNLAVASQVSGADAVIFDRDGKLLLCSDSPFGCEHQGWIISQEYVKRVLSQGRGVDTGTVSKLYPQRRYIVSVPITAGTNAIGFVMVSAPTTALDTVIQRISDLYLLVSVLVVLVSVILMTVFAWRQTKPLNELAQAANAFGHGELNARVPLRSGYTREMEALTLAFNNMASSLQKSEYQRQEFVANVSHELKTPMTTIGGYIDGMLDGTIPPEKQRHYMELVSSETKRLSRLVRSMLDISRLQDQGGVPEEKKTRFDICECAGQVLVAFEQKITARHLQVQVTLPEYPVYTHACQDYITQVIYNLVDNAVKFCPENGDLALTVREGGGKVYVSVANSGQTIPAQELPLVFDRFHKLDKSRSRNQDGWGLGLYIVKTIVCSHGENISVTSRDGRTEFTFTMPLVL